MADQKQQTPQQGRGKPRQSSTPPRRVEGPVVLASQDETALLTQTRGEIEIMMEMARRYPRSVDQFQMELESMTCHDQETADECIYSLPRGDKPIEGPSVRFSEIAMYCWGHMIAFAMPVSESQKTISCRGIAWDLERNVRNGGDAQRRILTSEGERYSDDMIIVTMNAGNSIAKRNAILQTIPSFLWRAKYEKAKVVAIGKAEGLATQRANLCDALQKIGARLELVWKTFGVKGPADLNLTQVAMIRGYYKAIRDGHLTVDDAFPDDTAPSLSGELVDAQMARLAEENMQQAADIEQEYRRLEFNQAQRLQKMTEFNGRWDEMLAHLRALPSPGNATSTTVAAPAETKAAAAETKQPETETKPATAETTKPVEETKAAARETVPVQQTIADVAGKADPFGDVKPSNAEPEKPKPVSKIEEARRRMNLKSGQTF